MPAQPSSRLSHGDLATSIWRPRPRRLSDLCTSTAEAFKAFAATHPDAASEILSAQTPTESYPRQHEGVLLIPFSASPDPVESSCKLSQAGFVKDFGAWQAGTQWQ